MARGTGRPRAALVLSDEERSFLEAQVPLDNPTDHYTRMRAWSGICD